MGRDGDTAPPAGPSERPSAEVSPFVLRFATVSGVLGGLAWIAVGLLHTSTTIEQGLHWGGGLLITVALAVIGMLMVRSEVALLRVFVAIALPVVVWGVFGILRDSRHDDGFLDVVFGVVVGLGSAVILLRRARASRATL